MIRALAAITLIGCSFTADYDGTNYSCPDMRCPPGYSCVADKCVLPGDGGFDARATLDAAGPDAGTCTAGSFANSCTGVQGIGSGQSLCASTASNTNDLLGCTGAPMPGPDAVFRITIGAGQTIAVTLRPDGFDGALYLLTDCSSACVAIEDESGVGGTETLSHPVSTAGDYFIAVDSPSGDGRYELEVALTGP